MVSLTGRPLDRADLMGAMGASLRHRGPDSSAHLSEAGAAIGVERLKIVDPTSSADQPFRHPEGTSWLACNGEIYNASALRALYPCYPWSSASDVEPLLPLLDADGPDGLARVEGMFAIAAWEPGSRRLTLCRDYAGEKPLFYTVRNGEVWFASEVQALLLRPTVRRDLDDGAVADYLTLGYVREPRTMLRDIRKVPAGGIVVFQEGRADPMVRLTPQAVFPSHESGTDSEHLAQLIERAVDQQLTADVPVGVFLSGGMDSSLLAALASRRLSGALATFTLRFQHASYDESDQARRVAKMLGSRHEEVMVTETTLLGALGEVTTRVAEPISDPAVLPTYLLARRAKESVGVVLSGEGADELFGGYPTYLGHKFARSFSALPEPVKSATIGLSSKTAASHRRVPWAYLVHRFAGHASNDWMTRHFCWVGTGLFPYLDPTTQERVLHDIPNSNQDPVRAAMELDYATYLREGLLTKVDRATMLSGLEARSPFLNPRLVAFARALPTHRKVRGVATKRILREVARNRLPRWVARRRKRGLSVPVADLINGGLRDEVDRLLSPNRLRRHGLLPELPVAQLLAEHRSGRANHARPLWALLMFQYWLENWISGAIE